MDHQPKTRKKNKNGEAKKKRKKKKKKNKQIIEIPKQSRTFHTRILCVKAKVFLVSRKQRCLLLLYWLLSLHHPAGTGWSVNGTSRIEKNRPAEPKDNQMRWRRCFRFGSVRFDSFRTHNDKTRNKIISPSS